MSTRRRPWTRDELIVVFNLYCRTQFGRMHKSNPEIVSIAEAIGRTPSAAAMKMVNFASLDPDHKKRQVRGLQHTSQLDQRVWEEFHNNWESLAWQSQSALERLLKKPCADADLHTIDGPTETTKRVRVRLVQAFFRDSILSNYKYMCAVCQLRLPSMVNASHIIPWSKDVARRADPTNGLSLCVFHDRAFDRGLIALDDRYRIVVSSTVKTAKPCKMHKLGLLDIESDRIQVPEKFKPDQLALAYHREHIFLE